MRAPNWLTAYPIAHRGLHDQKRGVPENSLKAVHAAMRVNYAIEIDVRPAADGTVMVFHDDTLDRLTGHTGRFEDHTAAQLREIKLTGTDEPIPTLDDLLKAVAGAVPLVIEIKTDEANAKAFAMRVAEQVSAYPGPLALMSFEPDALHGAAQAAPAIPRGLISYRWDDDAALRAHGKAVRWRRRNLLAAFTTGASFIAYDAKALPSVVPGLARRFGFALLTWTVRTADEKQRLQRHVDQIIFEGFRP